MKDNPIKNVKKLRYFDFITKHNKYCSPKIEIPGFQRNFVWPNKQIRIFIESIIENEDAFYIGNFLIQEGGGAGNRNLVVDGQQRIVTISLILAAVLNNLKLTNVSRRDAETMLFIDYKVRRLSFERKGVNTIFTNILGNKKSVSVKDKFIKTFETRYNFIQKEIKKIDANQLVHKIKALQLVVINCSSTHDVISLYQGLNSTSKRLTPVELIKSLIVEEKTNGQKSWNKLEQTFSERNPIWLDKFFRQHWFSVKGYVSGEQLYPEIRKYTKSTQHKKYLQEISNLAPIYLDIRDANIKSVGHPWNRMRKESRRDLQYYFDVLRTFGVDQIYAPILTLVKFGMKNDFYLTNSFLSDHVYRLLCFVILFKYSKSNPNKTERLFASFCKDVSQEKVTKKIFYSLIDKLFKNLKKEIPRQSDFVKKIIESVKYSKNENLGNSVLVKSILGMVTLQDGLVIPPIACDIEHIFPEGSEYTRWRISAIAKKELIENGVRLLIGNLTLLKPEDNQTQAKTMNFRTKFERVYKNDNVFIANRELDRYEFEGVNVHKAIKKRSKDVANKVYVKLSTQLDGK